jgi:hypothetical protein
VIDTPKDSKSKALTTSTTRHQKQKQAGMRRATQELGEGASASCPISL